MNRTFIIAAALLCACTAALRAQPRASYPATMYVTYDGAPLYDSAHHMSAVLEELPFGDSIRVLGVTGKFYRVERGEREGFLYWANIAAEKPKVKGKKKSPAKKRTATTAEPGKEKGEQTAGTDRQSSTDPLADSTAAVSSGTGKDRKRRTRESQGPRCRGITKSGGQCSRIATDPSGYCWQHRK